MARCRVDPSIKRVTMKNFDFPLGCYPVEDVEPIEGFTLHFEPADGGPEGGEGPGRGGARDDDDDGPGNTDAGDLPIFPAGAGAREDEPGEARSPKPGRHPGKPDDDDGGELDAPDSPERGLPQPGESADWEEWPDRYVFDVLIRASRVDAFLRSLFSLFPGRVFPILDVLGNDAYREIDPYVAYELVGIERFLDAVRRFRGYLLEDGFVGFGVMNEEPFLYVFVDEHKMVTIRAEAALKERVEQVLAAFDLKQIESLAGADSAVHEHRGVLEAPADRPDLLTAEEIVEELRDIWGLELNIDPHRNLDDQGRELGITGWRCVVRLVPPDGMVRYLEVCLTAGSLMEAHDLAVLAAESMDEAQQAGPSGVHASSTSPSTPSGAIPPKSRTAGKAGSPEAKGKHSAQGGDKPGRARSRDEDEDDDGAITTVDVVVTDRLAPEQLEELAKELGHKGHRPGLKTAKVWAARWTD